MTDVVIVGAGLSGCLAAINLRQRGFSVAVVDRYLTYPPDFRAEQIVGGQVQLFGGLLNRLVAGVPLVPEVQGYSHGKRLAPVFAPHYGLPYQDIVQGLRSQIPDDVTFIVGRVTGVDTGPHPVAHIDTGQTVAAKLVVIATGLNTTLSKRLGVSHQMLSKQRTVTVGFDIASPKFSAANNPILVYCGERLADGIDYLTIFPCKGLLRGNLFLFREPEAPWLRLLREKPRETLLGVLPSLVHKLGDFTAERVQSRASEVAVACNHQRDGIVFIGDAYQTPCPAAGTGIGRLAVDVQRLVAHVDKWFSANDVSAASLRSYYDDPIKRATDRKAIHDAHFRRGVATNPALFPWALHRKKIDARRYVEYLKHVAGRSILPPMRLPPSMAAEF